MDPLTLSALITAGTTIAGTGAQAGFTAARNKKQRRWSEMMDQRQWDRNIMQWHAQNKYNSPAEQRKRMIEGGFNPALMYKGLGGGAASPAPNVSPPATNFETPDVGRGIYSSGQAIASHIMQRHMLEQQRWKAKTAQEEFRINRAEADIKESTMDYQMESIISAANISNTKEKIAHQKLNNLKLTGVYQQIQNDARTLGYERGSKEYWFFISQSEIGKALGSLGIFIQKLLPKGFFKGLSKSGKPLTAKGKLLTPKGNRNLQSALKELKK